MRSSSGAWSHIPFNQLSERSISHAQIGIGHGGTNEERSGGVDWEGGEEKEGEGEVEGRREEGGEGWKRKRRRD